MAVSKTDAKEGSRLERTESIWARLVQRRRSSIRKSMIRPLYQEALKALYFVVVLLVDFLVPLQCYVSLSSPVNMFVALVVLAVFLFIEAKIYNALWGKKGRWSLSKYESSGAVVQEPKRHQ